MKRRMIVTVHYIDSNGNTSSGTKEVDLPDMISEGGAFESEIVRRTATKAFDRMVRTRGGVL